MKLLFLGLAIIVSLLNVHSQQMNGNEDNSHIRLPYFKKINNVYQPKISDVEGAPAHLVVTEDWNIPKSNINGEDNNSEELNMIQKILLKNRFKNQGNDNSKKMSSSLENFIVSPELNGQGEQAYFKEMKNVLPDLQSFKTVVTEINYIKDSGALGSLKYTQSVDNVDSFNDFNSAREHDSPLPSSRNGKLNQFAKTINQYLSLYLLKLEGDNYAARRHGLKPNISLQCINGLKTWQKGLKETKLWAIMMVDSWGKLPSGLLEGTLQDPGDFDLCIDTYVPGEFQGRYCELEITVGQKKFSDDIKSDLDAYQDHSKSLQQSSLINGSSFLSFSTSICLPSSCSIDDTKFLIMQTVNIAKIKLDFDVPKCLLKTPFHYTFGQKLSITIILAIIVLEIMVTVADYQMNDSDKDINITSVRNVRQKIILCLSLRRSIIALFKTSDNVDRIEIFNGFKFLTILWIIYGHIYKGLFDVFARKFDMLLQMRNFFFQIILSEMLAVDTFFFISGFLLVFLYMKYNFPSMNFFLYVFKRYLKLMLSVLFLSGSIVFVLDNDKGPFWEKIIDGKLLYNCSNEWWKIALCFNNYIESSNRCLAFTWYISSDIQLFTAAYFILLLFRKNPEKASKFIKIIIFLNISFLAVRHYYNNLPPINTLINLSRRERTNALNVMHFRTSNHVVPYCVGMLTGYFVFAKKDIQLSKVTKICGWLVSAAFSFVSIFTPYIWNNGRIPTTIESTLYACFNKLLWSIMLAWITYISQRGEGGIVTSILSWKGFSPLSHLTFFIYLVHPALIAILMGRLRHLIAPQADLVFHIFIALSVASIFLAFILHLTCESPLRRILNLLFSPSEREKESTIRRDYSVKINSL